MRSSRVIKVAPQPAKRYRVTNGQRFDLSDVDPTDTGTLERALLEEG